MWKWILVLALLSAAGVTALQWDAWVTIPARRAPLLALLGDPNSAEFRAEKISHFGALCGEFNSRNASGGYPGFRKYYVHGNSVGMFGFWPPSGGDTASLLADLDTKIAAKRVGASPFELRWNEICSG